MAVTRLTVSQKSERVRTTMNILNRDLRMSLRFLRSQSKKRITDSRRCTIKEKIDILEKCHEKVNLATEEASILNELSKYVDLLEVDSLRFSLQIKRLGQENQWLKGECERFGKRCETLNKEIEKAYTEKENFEHRYQMRNINDGALISAKQFKHIQRLTELPVNACLNQDVPLSSRLKSIYEIVMRYVSAGHTDVAIRLIKQIITSMLRNGGDSYRPDIAGAYDILSVVYRNQDSIPEAVFYLKKALAIREEYYGNISLPVASTLNNLAIFESKQEQFSDAERFCRKALEIREEVYGRNHKEVAKQQHNLALILTYLSRHTEAHSLFKKSLAIQNTQYSLDESSIVKTQNSIALCYIREHNYEAAEQLLGSVIDTHHQKTRGRFPDSDVDPSIYMIVLAYHNKPRRAVRKLCDCFESTEVLDIIMTLKTLATVYRKTHRCDHAQILKNWLDLMQNLRSPMGDNSIQCDRAKRISTRNTLFSIKGSGERLTNSEPPFEEQAITSVKSDVKHNERSSSRRRKGKGKKIFDFLKLPKA